MHCVSTILKTQMNRITNSNRCRIIRQLWECSINRTLYSITTVRQLGECLNVTISQSWIVALSLSHVAMYLTYLCTDSTSIWGVARHYLFTVLDCRTVTVTCGNVSYMHLYRQYANGGSVEKLPFHSREWPHCDTEHVRLCYVLLGVQVLVRSTYIQCRSTSTGGVFEKSD